MNHPVKKIHMVGICGVAMGSLAGMLKARGYEVSGSDEGVYPPMSGMLRQWGIGVQSGYRAENVGRPDLVIVGNAISRGNPEAEFVLDERIPYMSMAQALHDFFMADREVISVSGTHGKTTTTALLGHILEVAGESPSFFVGGVPRNYNSNFRLGSGRHFVIEGDEYDSAFFEKVPKFMAYRPQHLVLTSLEFDHADIYESLEEIKLWFRRLVNIVPANGTIVYSAAYPAAREVIAGSLSSCRSFGTDGADYAWEFLRYADGFAEMRLKAPNGGDLGLRTGLFGEFNYENVAAAASMALMLGIGGEAVRRGVESFEGVKRRQELIFSGGKLRIYEDFAHHPTAIGFVLGETRKRFPGAALWAVYEPRSATSRRNVFQEELPGSFLAADRIFIKTPFKMEGIPEADRLDIGRVIGDLRGKGRDARLFGNVDDIVAAVFGEMDPSVENVIVIMSNGGFDGIYAKMTGRAAEL